MRKVSISFSPEELQSVGQRLNSMAAETQAHYISTLVDKVGKMKGLLPDEKHEKLILSKLSMSLPQPISLAVRKDVLSLLSKNRAARDVIHTQEIYRMKKLQWKIQEILGEKKKKKITIGESSVKSLGR